MLHHGRHSQNQHRDDRLHVNRRSGDQDRVHRHGAVRSSPALDRREIVRPSAPAGKVGFEIVSLPSSAGGKVSFEMRKPPADDTGNGCSRLRTVNRSQVSTGAGLCENG